MLTFSDGCVIPIMWAVKKTNIFWVLFTNAHESEYIYYLMKIPASSWRIQIGANDSTTGNFPRQSSKQLSTSRVILPPQFILSRPKWWKVYSSRSTISHPICLFPSMCIYIMVWVGGDTLPAINVYYSDKFSLFRWNKLFQLPVKWTEMRKVNLTKQVDRLWQELPLFWRGSFVPLLLWVVLLPFPDGHGDRVVQNKCPYQTQNQL